MLLTKPVWGVLEYDLAAAMYAGLKSYWGRIKERRTEGEEFITMPPEVSLPRNQKWIPFVCFINAQTNLLPGCPRWVLVQPHLLNHTRSEIGSAVLC